MTSKKKKVKLTYFVYDFQIRLISTILIAKGSSLNFKEKLFVSLSWMAKASVQVCYRGEFRAKF